MLTYKQFLSEGMEFVSPADAYQFAYARGKGGRDPDVEKYLLANDDGYYLYVYIEKIFQNRWPKAEPILRQTASYWTNYLYLLISYHYSNWHKWNWLKTKIDGNLIAVLNFIGMTPEMQEYICINRPDLISEIEHLTHGLQKRFSHEQELSGVDL